MDGRIGVFDATTGAELSTLDVSQHPDGPFPNAVKGLALDHTGSLAAVLFHHRGSRLGGAGRSSGPAALTVRGECRRGGTHHA